MVLTNLKISTRQRMSLTKHLKPHAYIFLHIYVIVCALY